MHIDLVFGQRIQDAASPLHGSMLFPDLGYRIADPPPLFRNFVLEFVHFWDLVIRNHLIWEPTAK